MSSKPMDITDEELEELVRREPKVVVDFWAPWCQPCRVVSPIVEELAAQYGSEVVFAKVNIDDNPKSPVKYGIMGVPTLLFFKEGQLVERLVGVAPRSRIEDLVRKIL
jgi:thioredoxin 1